jgi:hypothetical protein
MAKKHQRTQSRAIVRAKPIMFRTPAPIVIRKTRTVHVKGKKKHHGHKRHHSKGLGGLISQKQLNAALGGAALGFIQKQFAASLPAVPIIGKNGTIALGAYLLRGKFPLADDICTAALVVSAFQLGSTGKVEGYVAGEEAEGGYVAGM